MCANNWAHYGLRVVFLCTLHPFFIIISYLKGLNSLNVCQEYLVKCVSKSIPSVIVYATYGAVIIPIETKWCQLKPNHTIGHTLLWNNDDDPGSVLCIRPANGRRQCNGVSHWPGTYTKCKCDKILWVLVWLCRQKHVMPFNFIHLHYSDVMMGMMASQITSLTIVYATVYSGADQRKHQSSGSLAFVRGFHRGPVNSPHKWPVTRKMFPFDDVIMIIRISITKSMS